MCVNAYRVYIEYSSHIPYRDIILLEGACLAREWEESDAILPDRSV